MKYVGKQIVRLWKAAWHYWLFSLALLALVAGLILFFTHQQHIAHIVVDWIALFEVIPLLWGMWNDLRDGSYGIDILAATAIISSVLLHQPWAAIVIVIMLTGGEALENYADRRATVELHALLSSAPQQAHVIKNKKEVDVLARDVQIGNKLIIRPGELVPVDATIVDGTASFDESTLTGESLPQTRNIGDALLSGSVNLDGLITAVALRSAADSQYEQIVKLVEAASHSKSPFVRLADRYSIPFTVVAFIIAIIAWVSSHQSIRFLDVMVVATPCPLILAAPIAVISGMSRATKHGVIVKTGSALEKMAEAKTIGFDKTGTLTIGQPVVSGITTFGKYKIQDVLGAAAGVEMGSNHVLALAIATEAKKRGIRLWKAKKTVEEAGLGLSAVANGKKILVGRPALMKEHAVTIPTNNTKGYLQTISTLVAIDGTLAGYITFEDQIRPETKRTLQRLIRAGFKHTLMVTGDNAAVAKAVAKKLGITDYRADALPVDKLTAIEQITDRPVVFVGDGVNDAPVLTVADVGIALGARGKTAASESADIVILLDDLERVAVVRDIAKRTFRIAEQSIIVGILLSIILMVIFSSGHFKPVYGALIQELVDVVVIFNALRAHGSWRPKNLPKLQLETA